MYKLTEGFFPLEWTQTGVLRALAGGALDAIVQQLRANAGDAAEQPAAGQGDAAEEVGAPETAAAPAAGASAAARATSAVARRNGTAQNGRRRGAAQHVHEAAVHALQVSQSA